MNAILNLYGKLITLSNMTLSPLLDLGIRLFMANIFFKSGLTRYSDYANGTWGNQIEAFTDYHPVPGVPGDIAAIAGTGGELILPILLALGLFTRLGAAGLLVMTIVIEFIVPPEYGLSNPDHYMWMLLLAVPMLKGGGQLSLDFLAQKFLFKKA